MNIIKQDDMEAVKIYQKTAGLSPQTLETQLLRVKDTIRWHCGLSRDELFWKILNSGQYYLKGRVRQEDYKSMNVDKGFWHWYEQVYCLNARWLIDANQWEWYDDAMSEAYYERYYRCKDYSDFEKYLRARVDGYTFEPVLIAQHNKKVYDGRVFW
jgi:hypothetical protein